VLGKGILIWFPSDKRMPMTVVEEEKVEIVKRVRE